MTDKEKLEKIRSEVIWYIHLRNEGIISGSCGDFEKLLKFIDSMQEEPTDKDFEAALAEEWKGYNDRGAAKVDALEDNTQELAFAKGFYRGWHYNKEKSVSEDLEEASKNYALNNTPWDDCKDEIQESFKAGAEWGKNQAMAEIQAQSMALAHGCPKEPITEDLGEYINELSKQFTEVSFAKLSRIAVRVAKWQKEQINEVLLSEVLPCFMHGGEADEVVAKLEEVLNKKK